MTEAVVHTVRIPCITECGGGDACVVAAPAKLEAKEPLKGIFIQTLL